MPARTAYSAPSIDGITEAIFNNLEALKHLYQNEEPYRANTYADVNDKSFIPSVLFFAEKDLYYTVRRDVSDPYVSLFWEWDPKIPLRGGNLKRTERGIPLPEVITRDDDKKPGEAITTHKQYYISILQDENAKIGDVHLRSCVDEHLMDFIGHFNNFDDYKKITMQTFVSMNQGIQLVFKLFVDTFIVSLFGGYFHNYPIGSPLYRFFSDAANTDTVPEESFSKEANAFFKPDGSISKKIKELAKWTKLWYKARFFYLTNNVESGIIGSGSSKKVPDASAMPVKMTTKEECLKAARSWYLATDGSNKHKLVGLDHRRLSLYSLVSAITGTVRELCLLDVRNNCRHDFYTENKTKVGIPLQARPEDLVVFMNDEDLDEARFSLRGSPAAGPFTESLNGQIERLENRGVTMVGVNYILPGHVAIFDKNICFKLKEFYQSDHNEYFAYHLIESRIKHVMFKPVLFGQTVFRALMPGADQKFTVSPYWASKNLPYLVEK